MQAIILAAGMGKRLKKLTANNTKCMIQVNGVTLIERMLDQLDRLQLSRIVVVVGYEGQKLKDYIGTLQLETPVCFVNNPVYDRTNNIYSLSLAKEYLLEEDTLLLESDLIFEDSVLRALIEDPRETLALVDKYESWMDGTCVKLGEGDIIEAFIPGKRFVFEDIPFYYKTVNIYKFGRHFSETHYIPFLEAYSKALGNNEYYEQVLRVITMLDDPEIRAKKLEGQMWYEIDDIQDLDIASSMFAENEDEKVNSIQNRYGGYWRYPKLLDFCYLVNPYFPPQKLMDEMKANFETLLTQYPSGIQVNSLLTAKNFDVEQEHIIVGNGAAELLKELMEGQTGYVGLIRPTFEEYPNRCPEEKRVVFTPANADLAYTADDIMDYFADREISTLIVINPDNPSGNYIPRQDLLRLIDWCEKRHIHIVVDESFVDFAEEDKGTLIEEGILDHFDNLTVIKSISKSYGVPGIRLGVMVSGNTERIAGMKKRVSIWNINSFGEFYMQIAEKYQADYAAALKEIKEVRREFSEELKQIRGLRVIPSQANYLMAELTGGMSARELTTRLLADYNIFIKNLENKVKMDGKQFIRLAVRNREDNAKLIGALKDILA